jgi:hypothetical protein
LFPAAWVARYWYGHCQSTATGEHVTLPSARHHDKAQAVQKTVASACNGTLDVEPSRQQPIAAIGNIDKGCVNDFTAANCNAMPPNLLVHYPYLWEPSVVRQAVETAWISVSPGGHHYFYLWETTVVRQAIETAWITRPSEMVGGFE